jgi:ArsR family transcriptional regulator
LSDNHIRCESDAHEVHVHALRSARTRADAALLFQALGSPERLQLVERLLDQEHCVTALAQELDEKVTTISQRLQQLHRARLLAKERRGKHIYYTIADHHVRDLLISTFDHVEEERLG